MKKNSTVAVGWKQILKRATLTIGLDLGDRTSYCCILVEAGNVIWERHWRPHGTPCAKCSAGWRAAGSRWKRERIRPG